MAKLFIFRFAQLCKIGLFAVLLLSVENSVSDAFSDFIQHKIIDPIEKEVRKISNPIKTEIMKIDQKRIGLGNKLSQAAIQLQSAPVELHQGAIKIAEVGPRLDDGIKKVEEGIAKVRAAQEKVTLQGTRIPTLNLAGKGLQKMEQNLHIALENLMLALNELVNKNNCDTAPFGILCDLKKSMMTLRQNIDSNNNQLNQQISVLEKSIQDTRIIDSLNEVSSLLK